MLCVGGFGSANEVSINHAKLQDLRRPNFLGPPSLCKSCRNAGAEGAKLRGPQVSVKSARAGLERTKF